MPDRMLDLIKPPTDNLYKFQALAGLLLALVSLLYPTWLYQQALLRYLDAKNGETELQTQTDYVQKRLDLLQVQMNTTLDDPDQMKKLIDDLENQRLAASSPKREALSAEIERLRKRWQESLQSRTALFEASQELKASLQSKTGQLAIQKSVSETELSMSRYMIYIGLVGIVIGVIITLRGFRQWSKRVQVYEDKILKREADKKPSSTP